jgi:hypothetical protein
LHGIETTSFAEKSNAEQAYAVVRSSRDVLEFFASVEVFNFSKFISHFVEFMLVTKLTSKKFG